MQQYNQTQIQTPLQSSNSSEAENEKKEEYKPTSFVDFISKKLINNKPKNTGETPILNPPQPGSQKY